jgi:CheY-like chemotaxis protein
VFEPFFTTKRVGQGTGLGLSVVHGIMTAHAGAIDVESEPGRGSSFHLYFPLLPHRPQRVDAAGAPPPVPVGRGQRVMVVDDDPAMLLMVESLLQRAGYRVTGIDQPREAAALLRHDPGAYDLVVTDYNMPELTGMELAAEIGRIRADLPVVISSGFISDEMRSAAQQAGIKGLMQKEYTLEQLGGIVHAVLNPG